MVPDAASRTHPLTEGVRAGRPFGTTTRPGRDDGSRSRPDDHECDEHEEEDVLPAAHRYVQRTVQQGAHPAFIARFHRSIDRPADATPKEDAGADDHGVERDRGEDPRRHQRVAEGNTARMPVTPAAEPPDALSRSSTPEK